MLNGHDFLLLLPEGNLVLFGLLVVLVDLLTKRREILGILAITGLVLTAVFSLILVQTEHLTAAHTEYAFSHMLALDPYAIFFKLLFVLIGIVLVLASFDYVKANIPSAGEFYALLLLSLSGMMFMASTTELISIYIALELASIPLYIMAGLIRKDPRSSEAAVKYVLLGAMSSAILLYGLALLYGLTGSTDLTTIATSITAITSGNRLLLIADIFILAGFGFKISAVPFHTWAPDIYEGSPAPATAFFSVGSKAAGFAALLRVFIDSGIGQADRANLVFLMVLVAMLTMTLGNLVACVQTSVKRLMAYSSIAQAGYIFVGIAASIKSFTPDGNSAVLFYLLSFIVTNLGAFAVIIAIENHLRTDQIKDYAGLAKRSPYLALCLALCLLSLAGIPPMVGFFAKIYIFAAAWQQGLYSLVVVGVINSTISIFYYLRIAKAMYVDAPVRDTPVPAPIWTASAAMVSVVGIVAITILANVFLSQATPAANALFAFPGLIGH